MASKRVHEIAKEQNLSSRELLEALRAAGEEVHVIGKITASDATEQVIVENGNALWRG